MLGAGAPCVVTDDAVIGRMAADYLRRKFHRTFGFVGSGDLPFSATRKAGFAEAIGTDALATSDDVVHRAAAIMRARACEGIGAGDIARACGCGRRTLEMRFKRVTGAGVAAHLRELQFQKACELLQTSSLPIYEIAARVGFDSQYHFIRAFKKLAGRSPQKWRRDQH